MGHATLVSIVEDERHDTPLIRYADDFHAWATQQAACLRGKRLASLDWANLADEVGDIARREDDRLAVRLERLCHQLILWDFGHLPRTESRAITLTLQRLRVLALLARCRSLEVRRTDALADAYEFGRFGALREDESLQEDEVPATNPYSWDKAMTQTIAYQGDSGESLTVNHFPMPFGQPSSNDPLVESHDGDLRAWALRQEQRLLREDPGDLDFDNLAGEIAALGRREYRALESALVRLIQHRLKWDFQPTRRSRSWSLTISEQRRRIARVLKNSPSLDVQRKSAVLEAYRRGRTAMLVETAVPERTIPVVDPYSWDDLTSRPVAWPEP